MPDTVVHDCFSVIFGESRGCGRTYGLTPSEEDAALRWVIWHGDVAAPLLLDEIYAYAKVALTRLRDGETKEQLWRGRSAPGGVVFNGALSALRAAGLYPDTSC